jgi:hypothetical protein
MSAVKCPGCQQTFAKGIAIRAHERSCAALRIVGKERLKKRGDNQKKRETAKLARLEEQTMDEIIEERHELRIELLDNHTTPQHPGTSDDVEMQVVCEDI